jgi:hypothetical protein
MRKRPTALRTLFHALVGVAPLPALGLACGSSDSGLTGAVQPTADATSESTGVGRDADRDVRADMGLFADSPAEAPGIGDTGADADWNADVVADSAADSPQDAGDDGFDACSLDPCGCRYPGPVTMTTHAIAICAPGMSTQLDSGFDADCIAADTGANVFPLDCSQVCGSGAASLAASAACLTVTN